MKYKHIIFDVDGTLIDTEYAIIRSLQDLLKARTGKEPDYDTLTFVLGITGEDALKKMGMDDIPALLELWIEQMNTYSSTIGPFKGIAQVLDSLSHMGYKLGIVTSRTRYEFDDDFRHFGIRQYFDTTICADDTKEHKPAPAPLLKYMELENAAPDSLLYIGDSKYDRECAKNAGVDFALALWGYHNAEIQADYYVSNPMDLLSIVKEI